MVNINREKNDNRSSKRDLLEERDAFGLSQCCDTCFTDGRPFNYSICLLAAVRDEYDA